MPAYDRDEDRHCHYDPAHNRDVPLVMMVALNTATDFAAINFHDALRRNACRISVRVVQIGHRERLSSVKSSKPRTFNESLTSTAVESTANCRLGDKGRRQSNTIN